MQEKNGTFLAFDFGLRRIGVAVGQTITRTATALMTLHADQGEPNWSEVGNLIEQWKPDGLVVGIPVNMDGSEQAITQLARNFGVQLQEHFWLPVYQVDERLTTKQARAEIFDSGGYRALQNTEIDSVAAQIILESWLQQR